MPELDVERVRRWCRQRVPGHLRDQVQVECDAGPGYLTIVECRPPWRNDMGTEWTRFPIARLCYTKAAKRWSLYWRDRNLRFHRADNDRVIFYSKLTDDRTSQILVAVNLDPYAPQEAILDVPLFELGIQPDEVYQVHELLSDERALWQGPTAQVRLTLDKPAAIWSVLRFRRSEQGFDYYF